MTVQELEAPTVTPVSPAARLASPWLVLGLLAGAHFLVDIVASKTNPIWPALERHLSIETGGLLWVYVCWSMATSFSQLFFGLWADRHPCRWLIWAGPLVAILCVSCVGLAGSPAAAAMLFIIGGCGVAAFHPEAAATAGSVLPRQRSRAMAIFALCGYLGQAVGPFYSGLMTDRFGLPGLTWGIVWGLPILFLLWLGLRHVPSPATNGGGRSLSGKAADDGTDSSPVKSFHSGGEPDSAVSPSAQPSLPIGTILLLLAVGALRMVPALGVPLALAYLLKATSTSNAVIGAVQSAFMAGIGIGAMACAAFLRLRWERTALWLFPLIAAPVLALLGLAADWTLVLMVGTCGVLLGVTMPVYISYGQQLLPNGQRVASSITMGVSWGISGGLVAVSMAAFQRMDALPSIFMLFAASSLASSLLCHSLPQTRAESQSVT
jgi:MFS transporter, FSR family, fosmidomycin resistance protein